MDVEVLVTPGLGDNSYLVSSGGEAVLIDPQRDVERFLTAAASKSVVIREVLETHVHNDYVSGALEIRAATGADLAGPAGGRYEFPIRGLSDGDDVKVGDLRLVAMETPGHTPEHLSYLVFEDVADTPVWRTSLPAPNTGRSTAWPTCPTRWRSIRPTARAASAARGPLPESAPPRSEPSDG